MIYYFATILLFLFVGSKKLVLNNKSVYECAKKRDLFIFIITAFFLCGGYMTGSDWRDYEIIYNSASWSGFKYYYKEQLFYVLMILCKYIYLDFFLFLILFKVIAFYIFYDFFQKFSSNLYISIFFFIPLFGLFLFIDNPLRFMISLGIIVMAYGRMMKKDFWGFIIIAILGSFFHIIAIFIIPFYFLTTVRIKKLWLTIIFLVWTFIFNTNTLLYIINSLINIAPYIEARFITYLIRAEELNRIISIGQIVNIAFFFWVLHFQEKIEANVRHGKIFFSFSIVYLFLAKIGLLLPTGFRFSILFAPFFIVVLTYLFQSIRIKPKKLIQFAIVSYILLVTFKRIDNHYVYIPYSNYFVHLIKGDLPPYPLRSNYNLSSFFERKGYNYHD